jgi:hypothetical protein
VLERWSAPKKVAGFESVDYTEGVTREIPGLRMSWPRIFLGFTASTQALPYCVGHFGSLHMGWPKLVLTFRGARALPEVAVKVLGFKG